MVDATSDDILREILATTRVIACVGVSTNPIRPSNYVARYLSQRKYRVIPVNPGQVGETLFGEDVVARIEDIPPETQVDMVDIFRRSEAVPWIVDTALEQLLPGLKTIWMQIGVAHAEAAAKGRAAGLRVVEDRCPKLEHQRLWGELRKAGFATGIISSKLPN